MKDLIIDVHKQPPSREWIDRYAKSAKRWHTKVQIGKILAVLIGVALIILSHKYLDSAKIWIYGFTIVLPISLIVLRFILGWDYKYRSIIAALQPIDSELSPKIFIEFSKLLNHPEVSGYVKKMDNRQPIMAEFEAFKEWVERGSSTSTVVRSQEEVSIT